MSLLLTRPSALQASGFEIDRGSFGVYDDVTGVQVALVLAHDLAAANLTYAATEHWILFPSYSPPAFNVGSADTTVSIRPIKPSSISSSWSQYDTYGDVPAATFVSVVMAAHPGSVYLKASVQLMP